MKRRDFLKRAGWTAGAVVLGQVGCGDDGGRRTATPTSTPTDTPSPTGTPTPSATETPTPTPTEDPCPPSTFDGSAEGSVAHILPTVSHTRMLIKVSFVAAQTEAPELLVGGCPVAGRRTDGDGLFWAFDADGLEPGRRYRLELRRGRTHLVDPWELATFPAPGERPARFRLLVYGCAGGHDLFPFYLPTSTRRRLLERALQFEPDAVVASGDHTYWILRTGIPIGSLPQAIEFAGRFDRTIPVLGTANEQVLKRAVGNQIAELYRTIFRSVPVFFLRDDHDYFEDDRITGDLVPFPADAFMRDLARSAQWLYYPEFLPDPNRPTSLPGAAARDRPAGVGEAFGTLRYGRLFEGLLYDCKGFISLGGPTATLTPPSVERWLLDRMADPEPDWLVNLPSNPPGWSAGKWTEWYPDVVADGRLTTDVPKEGWQPGWLAQHDRILAAASAMDRTPLFMAADIHSIAEERILRSGTHDFSDNPVVSVIVGPPGTLTGFPSVARGVVALPPNALEVEEIVPTMEVNGFEIVDFEPDRVVIRHFRWKGSEDPLEAIDDLMPFRVTEHPRRR